MNHVRGRMLGIGSDQWAYEIDYRLPAVGQIRSGLYSDNDVAAEIASDVADASTCYVLTFEGLRGDGPNEYHALEIKLDKPGLKALTRTEYYAQP